MKGKGNAPLQDAEYIKNVNLMTVKIVITCEDYWVADTLNTLANQIENTELLDEVYNKGGKVSVKEDNYTATITRTA